MRATKPTLERARRLAASGLLPEDPPNDDEPEEPSVVEPRPEEPSDWDPTDLPDPVPGKPGSRVPADDDSNWDVFIPEDDERDPLPEPGDFWIEKSQNPGASTSD